ncbi:MAG: SDR family NAD(P)-dependent oxidoreductase [Pseudomonadales bacterium]|nr:SDR family NAD(P)-dependent oxidoreductase [Pseudomonadales bacterium]MBO6594450.1 SDR family NAD(P)-dependent oxidoreductase [Pseudomonadales bacterium]MBO6655626.1 SDR family NAD(P)-dependent oxidoreductase [Pseudomonadales bacterium]MBO6700953.1 SDR family NAD(P)-dependent oxidoreductase [Pseudomonadales bacterium]MBO6821989.1 SDR family NAD(P)-dependent oxidoreductase [Pseudomonadales bacterium]
MTKTAVIAGVGSLEGTGAYLCRHAAREGLHVIASGRTESSLNAVCDVVRAEGGQATACVADVTLENDIQRLLKAAESIGPLDLAIYNAGNNFPGTFVTMKADYFESAWRVCTLGGFLFAQAAIQAMLPRNEGTLIFTGASASMRGRPNFAAFTAAKAGLRAMSQSLAREFQSQGIHVGHIVIDGGILGEKVKTAYPKFVEAAGEDGLIGLTGIAEAYMYLYRQPRNAWTHELDLRTHKESF